MQLKEAIEKILADAGRPLHYKEITDIALRRKLINPTPRPAATVSARLSTEMKKGSESVFIKVPGRPGMYALKNVGGAPQRNPHPKQKLTNPSRINLQVGKAGEYLVASELLFRGFDIWIPRVDSGTDLVAEKDGRRFDIQVKTGNALPGGYYQMLIGIRPFNRRNHSGTFYVFVMRSDGSTSCVVLPSADIEKMVDQGNVKKTADKYIVVKFFPHEGTYFLGRKDGQNVGYNINNWGIIK